MIAKDRKIFTASKTLRQVQQVLKKLFTGVEFETSLIRRGKRRSILVECMTPVNQNLLESALNKFVGYVQIKEDFESPYWHEQKPGLFHHYEVNSVLYKLARSEEVYQVTVPKRGSNKAISPWRFWRLSEEDFDKLRPYLNRWKPENIETLYAVVVKNERQADVANRVGIRPQRVTNLIKQALDIFKKIHEAKNLSLSEINGASRKEANNTPPDQKETQ